jgi:hypothetical protein
MAYSTIPAAVDRLLVVLAARDGLDGVHIGDGIPPPDGVPTENDRVYVDDAVEVSREWAQMGQYRIDESYTIQVPVEVFTPAKDDDPAYRTVCRQRLFAVIAEVEMAAVLDITLAGVLSWGVKPGRLNPTVRPTGDGWIGQAVVSLECSGRIQAS